MFAVAEGGTTGVIASAVYVVYRQLENRVIQPIVISKAVDLSPFVAMAAVLLGAAVAGVVGVVLATPLVGAVKLVATELPEPEAGWDDRLVGPRATPGARRAARPGAPAAVRRAGLAGAAAGRG